MTRSLRGRFAVLLAVAVVPCLNVLPARSDPWTVYPLDPGFIVNTHTTSNQYIPRVSIDPEGDFVVVWLSWLQDDGTHGGIFGQRYDSSSAKVGGEFMVNTYTPGDQNWPSLSHDPAGNFAVVWSSEEQDGSARGIFGQRFGSNGAKLGGEFLVNSFTQYEQVFPDLCHGPAGEFVVAWASEGQDGYGAGVFGQRFASSGAKLGSEFQVNTTTVHREHLPSVACDPAGNFVVTFTSNALDGDGYGVFAQRFNSSGAKLGSEFLVNSNTTNEQSGPTVSCDRQGNFVIAWNSIAQDGDGGGVFAQRFDRLGTRLGQEFLVNVFTPSEQYGPELAHDYAGNFVIAYTSRGFIVGDDVTLRAFDPAGNPLSGELALGCIWVGDQFFPHVAFGPGPRLTVVAETELGGDGDLRGVRAQRLFRDIPLMAGAGPGSGSKAKQLKRDWLVPVYCPP